MKKISLTILSATALLAAFSGCTATAQETPDFTVGICQYVQHEALDAATRGFQDALIEELGDQVQFDLQNAQGDYATCATILNSFLTEDVDLILANATAPLQAAATATAKIPILGTSVTDYSEALQLSEFDGILGNNISGTSDLAPLNEQAAMIKELFPDAKTIGILYSSSEPNSQYQVQVVSEELEQLGYACKLYSFSDSNDLSPSALTAASECDALYVPTDNAIASNAELVANVCIPQGIPVIAGEENTCRICGVATLSINYYDLGRTTGEMAARILTGSEDISAMPIEYTTEFTKRYNKTICEKLGIQIPEGYEPLEELS